MSSLEGSPEPGQDDQNYDDWYIDDSQEPTVPPHEIILPCFPTLSDGLYHLILASVSLCTLLFLCFLIRRQKLCTSFCWGVPGVLSPLNLLEGSGNNWVPCAAFGLLFSSIFRMLLDPTALNFIPYSDGAHKEFWKILALFYYPALYYPLLASYSVQRIPGYIVGTILSWMHCGALIWQKVECPQTPQFYSYYSLLATVPQICCLILLSIIYPTLLLQKLRQPSHSKQMSERNYYLKYLKKLLRRKASKTSKDSVSIGSQVSLNLCSYLCSSNIGFRLSQRSLMAATVSVLSAYQVALLLLVGFLPTVKKIRSSIDAEFILMLAGFGVPVDEDKAKAVDYIVYYIWTVEVCYIAAMVLSCAVTVTMLLRSLVKHRWALQSLCAGKVTQVFLKPRSLHPSPPALASWMSHISYQAAVTCIGLILQHVILFLVHLIVTFLIIIPIAYGKFQIVLPILERTWPFWLLLLLVTIVQHLSTRFIFLQGSPWQTTNRRVLFLFTYIFLPVNILRGGLLAIARLVISLTFNVIHFCRLDLSLLQHSVQSWDPGYRNYCNFLLLEVTECHPLVTAFCLLLKPPCWKKPDLEEGIHLMPADGRSAKGARSHLARARWGLAYTLIHNPSLVSHRGSRTINGGSPPCSK
ncbi:receptor for retinol uptake STRA6 [Hyla sarda]|uniref:receptor for retinol uptake STRA6 n=1 Tax=Hyla sarda TaxID=327740 RepID=UPI0024C387A9|nr:receptor for retinol uptake STRA6 [Hyla sarda]